MRHFYMKNHSQSFLHKILVLGFLFLTLTLVTFAQGRKAGAPEGKSNRTGASRATVSSSGSSLEQHNLRNGTPTRGPRNAEYYQWYNNEWYLAYKHLYTYNAAGYLTEEVITNSDGTNSQKYTTAYDSRGNETEDLYYAWENNQWVLKSGEKTTYTYTSNRLTEQVSQYFKNGAWALDDKKVYVYDSQGRLTERIDYDLEGSGLVLDSRDLFAYTGSSAMPTSVTYLLWTGSAWVNEERETGLAWYNFDKANLLDPESWQFTSLTFQTWENNAWVNQEKENTTYSSNGSSVEIEEEWVNGAWVNAYRSTTTLDDKGNETLYEEQEWENGTWRMDYGYKTNLTYNSTGDITSVIFQMWERSAPGSSSGTYVNQYGMQFSNFQVLSAKEELHLAAQVYPNPVQDRTFLTLDQPGEATVKVVSLAGRTVFSSQLNRATEAQEINLAGLPAGTYLLQIQTKAGTRTKKIVKL